MMKCDFANRTKQNLNNLYNNESGMRTEISTHQQELLQPGYQHQ